MYEIESGEFHGTPVEGRGRKARYPFLRMIVGQWVRVPQEEESMLQRAVRYARRGGVTMQIMRGADPAFFIIVRVR